MMGQQVIRTWYALISIWVITMAQNATAQSLADVMSYHIAPSCDSPDPNKPTATNQYYLDLRIDELAESGDFEIVVDRNSLVQFHVDEETTPYRRSVGPFNHSTVGGTYHEYILRSLTDGSADTLYLPELVCGHSTSNGLNNAGYYCGGDGYGIVAQVTPEVVEAPGLPDKAYVYVLALSEGTVVVNRNFSGYFGDVEDLHLYEVHAYSTPFEDQAAFINSIVIGEPLDQNDLSTCFAVCGVFEVMVDCSSFDLSLSKQVRGGYIYSEDELVIFDISVTNDGTVTAYDIVVEDMLPISLDFLPGMNPEWNSDGTSHPIDSILPGATTVLPIYVRVNDLSPTAEIINTAEIIFATSTPGDDVAAFDSDSTPDNEVSEEDDQAEEEIIVLENLCDASFEVDAANQAVCLNGPLTMAAMISAAAFPVKYTWRFDGDIVSRDSIYTIENHQPSDYGNYSLTIIDGNGCSGTEHFDIQPVNDQERFSCYTDINVGVNADCEVFLSPEMFTSRPVSGLSDYIIEIRDGDGQLVSQNDLYAFGPNTTLEAKIINPCTFETICWSNLHIEHKATPEVKIYREDVYTMLCPEYNSDNPTELIDYYNNNYGEQILDASIYADSFNQLVCLQEWQVETIDQLKPAEDACSAAEVNRIYYVFDQERRLAIDTATILILPLSVDSIRLPEDASNIVCSGAITPFEIESYPSYYNNGILSSLTDTYNNQSTSFCNIGVSYTDQDYTDQCSFGTSKIIRSWSVMDWCTNEVKEGIQYLFVVDKEPPALTITEDNVKISTAPFECFAIIDLTEYFTVSDFCDASPFATAPGLTDDITKVSLPQGTHDVTIQVEDKCGNVDAKSIVISVNDNSLPIPILKDDLTISLVQEDVSYTNYIDASFVDAGSHDHDCGPVSILIARTTELAILTSLGGTAALTDDLLNCMSNLRGLDMNSNGSIDGAEIFRKRVHFCCQDIGQEVRLIVQVTDESGNVALAEMKVFVDVKLAWTSCDDANPCTINDRSYGDCPCSGTPEITDLDEDGIVDCQDDAISMCIDEGTIEVNSDSVTFYISQGAIYGPCDLGLAASIAGEIFTTKGEMVEGVMVTASEQRQSMTGEDGYYRIDDNEMYVDYSLYPELDEDHINGVTTLDLVFLEEYILGRRKIDDPYLKIAADVNNDGRITGLDILELRLLMLGQSDRFTNKSWRFVIEDYSFEDITRPYDFQEINVLLDLDRDMMNENWIGIKIGDLNHSARANSLKSFSRSDDVMIVDVPDMVVQNGDKIIVPVSVKEEMDLIGLQMRLDISGLRFDGLRSGDLQISPDQYHLKSNDRYLNIVWHDREPHTIEGRVFSLEFIAEKNGHISDMISLDNFRIKPLIVSSDYLENSIEIEFVESLDVSSEAEVLLYQNQPNPFNGETMIQFYIPESDEVSISFYDGSGRLINTISDRYNEGINAIRLTDQDLAHFEGLVYYQMTYRGEHLSRKMVVNR